MKKYLIILFAALGMTLASCDGGSSNNDYIISQDISGCFSYTDDGTGAATVNNNIRCRLEINYTQATIALNVYNFKLPDGTSTDLTFTNIPAESDKDGWITASAPIAISTGTNATISNFKLKILQRFIQSNYVPAYLLTFNVDSSHSVLITRSVQYFGAKTTTTSPSQPSPFESKSTIYGIAYNFEKKTSDLAIIYARFISNMPSMSFDIKEVPAELSMAGITFSADKVIPNLNNAPAEKFPITNLRGSYIFSGEFQISFDCVPGIDSLNGAEFHCSASGTYLDMPEGE